MRIVLTGATSFLGRALLQELRLCGHTVYALRHSFEEEAPGTLPTTADVWIHFAWAGVGSAGRSDETLQNYNVEMTMAALKKAEQLSCRRFLFAGSQAEYGNITVNAGGRAESCAENQGLLLQYENRPLFPVSAYGKAKAEAGRRAAVYLKERAESLCYLHMRIFSVYGPGDHETALIPSCISSFLSDNAMEFGACTQLWNYLYITDAVRAVRLLAEAGESELQQAAGTKEERVLCFNVAGSDTRPLRSYIEELHRLCESNSLLLFGKRPDNAEGNASLCPDISRLTALGFRPEVSFAAGIQKMLSKRRTA